MAAIAKGNQAPIGVFDSGVGGLTVIRALQQALPQESFLYYGDTAHVPYGNRRPEELRRFALQIGNYLQNSGCKMLLIACNTSTALAYQTLKQTLTIPVVGVIEPAVNKVCNLPDQRPVGIIATQATVDSGAYQNLFAVKAPKRQLRMMACPAFVPLVEAGVTKGSELQAAVREYLTPLKAAGIGTLIMGCTHYPFLAAAFREFLGDQVVLLDPALETVARGREILAAAGLLAKSQPKPDRRFVTSGDPQQFCRGAGLFLPYEIQQVAQVIF